MTLLLRLGNIPGRIPLLPHVQSRRSQSGLVGRGSGRAVLGIRRETINAWERRAPLAPRHVKKLTREGVKVLIQPSNRRAFPIQEYVNAGAIVQEDLSEAQLIMSVKQVPIDQLIPEKAYAFFSHTIKAQPDNMPMLDNILQKKIRLIDYEKMVDAKGKRLVMFGKWAGYAGFIDVLHGIGLRLLALGHHTPFLHIALAHNYSDSHMAINAVRDAGYEIALGNMPRSLGPLTFVFTGSGNVSQGAQELFQHLPHEFVDVSTLPKVARKGQLNKVYGCIVTRADHMVPKNGGPFVLDEFEAHPERYISKFASDIAPWASVIINGVFWGVDTPRLITIPDAKNLMRLQKHIDVAGCPSLPHRLIALCDISADPGGSIEFMDSCTTIDKPFNVYDAESNSTTEQFDAPSGCLVCSIDNMPAQMPIEATEQFGNLLLPYVPDMLACAVGEPYDRLKCQEAVKGAVITSDGRLTPPFSYIADLRRQKSMANGHKTGRITAAGEKNVLLLGAGMVAGPVSAYFANIPKVSLTVATESEVDAARVAAHPNARAVCLDVAKEKDALRRLIGEHNVVISLLPYTFHPTVAKLCIEQKKSMVTSSYVSPELQALDDSARAAGITLLNECGLDPGIDHLLAMDCFDRIREHGGKVTSFVSFCGGLPAPEFSDNALRYKFSWSPKGVLLALKSAARYRHNGQVVDIAAGRIVDHLFPIHFHPGFKLVGMANRDSTKYADIYGLDSDCRTLIRGTLRYEGYVETVRSLDLLGLLSDERSDLWDSAVGPDLSWKQLMAQLLNQQLDIFPDSLRKIAAERLDGASRRVSIEALEQLGLFSDAVAERDGTAVDTLAKHLSRVLAYGPNERDLIILNHDIEARLSGGALEQHRISLVSYGEQPTGYSAMARTVGYTTAIAANMVLQGEIQEAGVLRPTAPSVYQTMLKRLAQLGITATHTVQHVPN